jgi:hypothetical protein
LPLKSTEETLRGARSFQTTKKRRAAPSFLSLSLSPFDPRDTTVLCWPLHSEQLKEQRAFLSWKRTEIILHTIRRH